MHPTSEVNVRRWLSPLVVVALMTLTDMGFGSESLKTLAAKFPESRHATVMLSDGVTHYEDTGSGPVVILIHGVSGPMQVWDKQITALTGAGYRVLRYDLYGRGLSARVPNGTYDLPLYQKQLEDLLSALHVEGPVALVGSSFGAVISTEFALRHPDRARGLVLVGPAGFPITVPLLARLGNVPLLGELIKALFAKPILRKQNRNYAFDGQLFTDFWPYFDAQLEVPGTAEAMLATMKNSPVTSSLDSYEKIGRATLPVGVIWGRQDATFPYNNHMALLKAVPRAQLVTVEESAHLPQWEKPEVTTKALLNLLGLMQVAGHQ